MLRVDAYARANQKAKRAEVRGDVPSKSWGLGRSLAAQTHVFVVVGNAFACGKKTRRDLRRRRTVINVFA